MAADRARLLAVLDDLGVQGLSSVDPAAAPGVEVRDPVYALALDAAVDTNVAALELGADAATYRPDAFPGVVYRGGSATVFVFGTGHLVVPDAGSREAAESAIATVVARLVEAGLVDAAAVPEAGGDAVALPADEDLPPGVGDAAAGSASTEEPACATCGHDLDGTENFCPACGATLRD
ncbi:MAG: hypothetical protein ABEJ05_06285 [Haloglomus sp.]